MKHQFAVELLRHFNCGMCGQWWSISGLEPKSVMFCPHCGTSAETEEIDIPEATYDRH